MRKKYVTLPIILILFFFSLKTFSQDYTQDSLAVRAILDSNGFFDVTVEEVTEKDSSRIVNLIIHAKNLTKIPSQIGNLTALIKIEIINTSLTSFPPEIGKLTSLENLNLNSNLLNSIPKEFGNLVNLKFLNLHNNSLSELPSEIITPAIKHYSLYAAYLTRLC